jgi:hypothetical protein
MDGFGDPVAVMVLGAGPADVETVIVGGDVVKRDGKLTGDSTMQALELMHATRRHLRGSQPNQNPFPERTRGACRNSGVGGIWRQAVGTMRGRRAIVRSGSNHDPGDAGRAGPAVRALVGAGTAVVRPGVLAQHRRTAPWLATPPVRAGTASQGTVQLTRR